MSDYVRIARAYFSGTAVAVWCILFLCLLGVSAIVEEIARNQGGMIEGVLSRKSYLAIFAYFNACVLGVLLRDNIAHPWASVVPHYRKKHLLVTALIALFFLGIPMFSMAFVGTSEIAPTSVAVIFLTCLAAGLWTLHHPGLGVLALPFLVFAFARASSSPELAAFLAGTTPAASIVLTFISLLAILALAWRLLAMNEEMFEYVIARGWGDLLRGRGFRGEGKTISEYLAALPADQRTFQNSNPNINPFSNLKQVDNLHGCNERSLWQRLQLWRLGTSPTRTFASVGGLILLSLIMIGIQTIGGRMLGAELLPARDAVAIFSVQVMMNPFNIWLPWFIRVQRLGYESLRPRTRQEFVRELGLALLWDIIQCWLGGALCMVIASAIWAPELLQLNNLLLFILCTGVGQLCVYSLMGIWFLKRGIVASVSCAFCAFMTIAIWMVGTINGRISIELNFAITATLAAASAAIIALSYRHWCQEDLE